MVGGGRLGLDRLDWAVEPGQLGLDGMNWTVGTGR